MKAGKRVIAVIGCLGVMLGAVGCASNEVVKKDEPIASKEATTKTVVASPLITKTTPDQKKVESQKPVVPAVGGKQSSKASVSQAAFEKIYFDFDSSDLSKSSRDILAHNGEILMKDLKNAKLSIEGHCDERGSAEYNLALGERRAQAAAKYLSTMGVQADRLSIISYGKERPAVQGDDEAAWSKNRRDEFVVKK